MFPHGQRVDGLAGGHVVASVALPPGQARVLTFRVPARDGRRVTTLRTAREAHVHDAAGQRLVRARYTAFAWRS